MKQNLCPIGDRMTYQEKLDWLEKIFSNDPRVRAEAMNTEIPQPLFESQDNFAKALKDLENERQRDRRLADSEREPRGWVGG